MNQENDNTVYLAPKLQLVVILLIMIVFVAIGKAMEAFGLSASEPLFPWTVAASMLLLFSVFNCAFSLSAKDANKYWLHSIIVYVLLCIATAVIAYLITDISINDAKSIKWIYFVFTFGYLVFLSIVNLVKLIVRLAKKEDVRLGK